MVRRLHRVNPRAVLCPEMEKMTQPQQYTDVEKIRLERQFRQLRRKAISANVAFCVLFFASPLLLLYIKHEGFLKGLVILSPKGREGEIAWSGWSY